MKVSVVIPNWNGEARLNKNLPSVLKLKGVEEIIVVDDASTDQSVKLIREKFTEIILVEKKVNTRFADTVDTGVKKASGELVFILNNDASPHPDCLLNTLRHFKDPKVFSVNCNDGGNWTWAKFERGFFWHFKSDQKISGPHQTLWASGGYGVFRKSIWDELGGFDTLYAPFYEEDTDLGYRATKRGFINIFEPGAKIVHNSEKGVNKQNFSQDFISKIAQRNQLIFIWKNITSDKLFKEHKNALFKMLIQHPKYWSIFLASFKNISEIKQKRAIEKKEQKVTDEEILAMFNQD